MKLQDAQLSQRDRAAGYVIVFVEKNAESECFWSVFLTPCFDAVGLMQVILYRSVQCYHVCLLRADWLCRRWQCNQLKTNRRRSAKRESGADGYSTCTCRYDFTCSCYALYVSTPSTRCHSPVHAIQVGSESPLHYQLQWLYTSGILIHIYRVSQKSSSRKTFCNIFGQAKYIFMKFCQYIASLCPHIFTNFCWFI